MSGPDTHRMPAIYRKTFKGLAELEDRTHGLTPRMRALLILVDGQRDSQALRMLWSQEVQPSLAELHREGYIEPVGKRRPRKPPAPLREPVTVVLPPAPMADVDIDELPGFVPLPGGGAGQVGGAGGGGIDLLLDDLGAPGGAAVSAPVQAPAVVTATATASPDVTTAAEPEAPATPVPVAPLDAPSAAATPAASSAAPPETATAPPAHPPEAPRDRVFEARRRAAVRALHDEVGDDPDPQVHDLAVRMVRSQTPEALQPLLVEGAQLIARLRDRIAAGVYAMRFLA